MALITKNVTTLEELHSTTGQSTKALVIYDTSSGEPQGLDVEVLINMNTSIAGMDASVGQVWTMAQTIAQEVVAAADASLNVYKADVSVMLAETEAALATTVATNRTANHLARVATAGGTVQDPAFAQRVFDLNKNLLIEGVCPILAVPACGMVEASGKIARLFNMADSANDLVQATAGSRPYVGGGIAPNEKKTYKAVLGQTQSGEIAFESAITYGASDSWTILYNGMVNAKSGDAVFFIGAAISIEFGATYIKIFNGVDVLKTYFTSEFIEGKNYSIEFQYSNGVGLIKINGVSNPTTCTSSAVSLTRFAVDTSWKFDGHVNLFEVISRTLSAYESNLFHAFLAIEFPAIETIAVGSQQIATSNLEATVFGGVTIPEVQSAGTEGNAELVVNGTFTTDTVWGKEAGWTINTGTGKADCDGSQTESAALYQDILEKAKIFQITYTVSNRTAGTVTLNLGGGSGVMRSTDGTYTEKVQCGPNSTVFRFDANADFIGSIDNVSVRKVGTELITAEADRMFSSDTGWWTKEVGITIADGVSHFITAAGGNGLYKLSLLEAGKNYLITYTVSGYSSGGVVINIQGAYGTPRVSNGTFQEVLKLNGYFKLEAQGTTTLDIDNISIVELGWSDSQYIYYTMIAQGSTVAAANIGAAMWAHYDNLALNGAIYGKLYNGFAVPAINTYCPKGFHVPSSLELTMLSEYLGGDTVSGGKMKALYGAFDNAFATNESGVSLMDGGMRTNDGTSYYQGVYCLLRGGALGVNYRVSNGSIAYGTFSTNFKFGAAIRLFSNTPHLATDTYTSGLFATDIASSPKSIRIAHSCKTKSIKFATTTNVTSIEAKLYSYDGTELETLITGKSCNNTTKVFDVNVDQTLSYTDAYIRITASGNGGSGMTVDVKVEVV